MRSSVRNFKLPHALTLLALFTIGAPSRADMQDGSFARGLCSQRSGGNNDQMWQCCNEEVEVSGPERAAELAVCRAGITQTVPKAASMHSPNSSTTTTKKLPKGQSPESASSDGALKPIAAAAPTAPTAPIAPAAATAPIAPTVRTAPTAPTAPKTASTARPAEMLDAAPFTQDSKDPTKMLIDCTTTKGKQMYDMMSRNSGMIPGGFKMECKAAQ
jgi:hypothetical protein